MSRPYHPGPAAACRSLMAASCAGLRWLLLGVVLSGAGGACDGNRPGADGARTLASAQELAPRSGELVGSESVAGAVKQARRGAQPTTSQAVQAPAFIHAKFADARLLELLQHSTPTRFSAVGSTSTVFRTRMDGPVDAAFKTRTKTRPFGPQAEVVAYRLARCLQVNTVPPAISRSLGLAQLAAGFSGSSAEFAEIRQRFILGSDGQVQGAVIYWIEDLTELGLDTSEGIAAFTGWLSQGQDIPDVSRELAASISTMLLFDYVIGNLDRFSGSNAKGSADGRTVYVRDHDLAFPARLTTQREQRLHARLARAQRFSARVVTALRDFRADCLQQELAQDPAEQSGQVLLSPARWAAMSARRKQALAYVDQLIARYGAAAVLSFP